MENDILKDLLVISADSNMKAGITAILNRPEAIDIRPITFEIYTHPEHDPGCRCKGASFSRLFIGQFSHCLMLFDHEGCGAENTPAHGLEKQIEQEFNKIGW